MSGASANQSFDMLIRLARSDGHQLRMSELAVQASLTPSGLTRAVDRLPAAGPGDPADLPRRPARLVRPADPGRPGDDGPGHPRAHLPTSTKSSTSLHAARRRRCPPSSDACGTTPSNANLAAGCPCDDGRPLPGPSG